MLFSFGYSVCLVATCEWLAWPFCGAPGLLAARLTFLRRGLPHSVQKCRFLSGRDRPIRSGLGKEAEFRFEISQAIDAQS
jgi:hypothetical protein